MARLHHVAKARESKEERTCRRCGVVIKKGDAYYWFANRIGRTSSRKDYCSKHRPRASEMTTSGHLANLYGAQESVEDAMCRLVKFELVPFDTYKEDVAQALDDAAQVARDEAEEYRSSKENMPEGLQEGEVGQQMEESADQCESWADTLEQAAQEVRDCEETAEDTAYDVVDALANSAVGELEL